MCYTWRMQLWLRDRPQRDCIGPLPDSVQVNLIPAQGAVPREIVSAEFLVPPFDPESGVLRLVPQMRSLRVVQTVSAGVESLLPHIPDTVTVCNARDMRAAPVSEWVLGVILAAVKDLPTHWRRQTERHWAFTMP